MSKSNSKNNGKGYKGKDSYKDQGKGKRSGSQNRGKRGRDSSDKKDRDFENRGDEQLMLAGNGSTNDPEWYMSNSQFVLDVSRVPFSNVQGRNLDADWNTTYSSTNATSAIPGIAVVRFMPVPGLSETATSGLNLAANNLAQIIRSRLSTVNTSYEPADIAMCILGVDSIYTLYCHIARIFGLVNQYSMDNFYYPKAMIKALTGWNDGGVSSLFTQVANLRARFNNAVYKASQLYQPTTFTITKRHATLCNNIYVDGMTGKSQFYAFAPEYVFKLNETASNQGTALQPMSLAGSGMVALLNLFEDMIEQYRNSTSMNKMFADMRRAFGDENTYQLAYVDEEYMTPVVHDDYILYQIYNMTMPSPIVASEITDDTTPKAGSFWVYQNVDKNIALFTPEITTSKGWHQDLATYGKADTYGDVYNFHTNTVDSALLLESSRLKYYYHCTNPGEAVAHYTWGALGTELITRFNVYTLVDNMADLFDVEFEAIYGADDRFEPISWAIAAWSAFDWAPMFKIATPGGTEDDHKIMPLYDWDNYTKIGHTLQNQMNTNILLNMWYNPVSTL